MKKINSVLFFIAILMSSPYSGYGSDEKEVRSVVDSRGIEVKVPKEINRIIVISDGLVESTLIVLGEIEKVIAVGSSCLQTNFKYEYPSVTEKSISYKDGMNTATYLHKRLMDIPRISSSDTAPNFEAIASLNPDVMFVRVGSCWQYSNSEAVPKAIKTLEGLGIPLIVLHSPMTYKNLDMSNLSDEIRIIGRVFGKEGEADSLATYLEKQIEFVVTRTETVPEKDKPRVLLFGLSPRDRNAGAAGNVKCLDDTESYFLEELVHARNAFREKGSQKILSTENILALDPDAIVLPTSWGYHPPEEIYEAPYYQNLRELNAVKNRRVAALPWTPCNCDKRLEYPIDVMVMAKTAYPDRFKDVDLAEWLLEFYQNVYKVDRATAIKLRKTQFMEWTLQK